MCPAVAVGSVLVLLASVPSAGAAAPSTTLRAPFFGTASVENWSYGSIGCAHLTTTTAWSFHLHRGAGGVAQSGNASACPGSANATSGPSAAVSYRTLALVLPFQPPKHGTRVSAEISLNYSLAISASDGVASGPAPSCPVTSFYRNDSTYEWGGVRYYDAFTGTNYTLFSGYNVTDVYAVGSRVDNVSFGTGAPPSPFAYNNSTEFLHSLYYGQRATCSAAASVAFGLDGALWDRTNGSYVEGYGWSGDTLAPLAADAVQVSETIDWSCQASVSWIGNGWGSNASLPGSWTNQTPQCVSGNSSFASLVDLAGPVSVDQNGTLDSLAAHLYASTTGALTWHAKLDAHHVYFLELWFTGEFGASNSWPAGRAAFLARTGGSGHGLRIVSVDLS